MRQGRICFSSCRWINPFGDNGERGNIIFIFFVLIGLLSVVGMSMISSELTHYKIIQNDKNSQIAMTLAEAGVEKGLRMIRNSAGGSVTGSLLVQDGAGLGGGSFDVKSEVGTPTADIEWTTVGFNGGYDAYNEFENELIPPVFLGWSASVATSELNPAARSIYSSVVNQKSYFYYQDVSKNVRVRALNAFTGEQVWETNLGRGRISFGSVVGISGTDRVYFIYDSQVLRNTTGLTIDTFNPASYSAAAVHNRPQVVALKVSDGSVLWRFPNDDATYVNPDDPTGLGNIIQGMAGVNGDNQLSRPVIDGVLGDTEAVSTALVPIQYTRSNGTVETHLYFNVLKRMKFDQINNCSTPPSTCLSYGGNARGWNAANIFNNVTQVGTQLDLDFQTTASGANIDDLRLVFDVSNIPVQNPPPTVTLTLTTNWTDNDVTKPKPPLVGTGTLNPQTNPLVASNVLADLGGGVYQFPLYTYGDCDGDALLPTPTPDTICHDENFQQNYHGLTFVRERSLDGSKITLYVRNDPPPAAAPPAGGNKARFGGHVRVNGAVLGAAYTRKQEVMALDNDYNINNPQYVAANVQGRCDGNASNARVLNSDTTPAPGGDDCEREFMRVFHIVDMGSMPRLVWEFPNQRYTGLVSNVRIGNDWQWSKGEIGHISMGRFYTTSATSLRPNVRTKRFYTMATEVVTYDEGSSLAPNGFTCPSASVAAGSAIYCPDNATSNTDGKTINDFYPLQRVIAFAFDDMDMDGDWVPDSVRQNASGTTTYTWEYAYDPYELEGTANPDTLIFYPNILANKPTGSTVNYTYGTLADPLKVNANQWLPFSQMWGQVPVVFKDDAVTGTARVFITGKGCEQPTSTINCRGETRGWVIALRDNYEEQTGATANNPFSELWAYQVHEDEDDAYCFLGSCLTAAQADGNDVDLQQDIFAVDDTNFYFTWNNDVGGAAPAAQHIAALRLTDGVEVWNKLYPVFNSGITTHSSPAVANGVVYFGITQADTLASGATGHIHLYAISAADGSTLDNVTLPDNDDTVTPSKGWPAAKVVGTDLNNNYYGFNMSPALANNAIYVGVYGGGKQRFFGLSPDFNIRAIGHYGGASRTVRVAIKNGVPTFFREGYD